MLEFISLLIFTILVFGCVVILMAIAVGTYLGFADSQLCRRIRLWRRERLVNKFMEDLKK